jgi:hypothetical protein
MPLHSMVVRNLNPLLYRPGLDKNFRDGYITPVKEFTFFFKTENVDTPEVSMATITGPSRLYPIGDGEPYPLTAIQTGFKAAATDIEFGGAYAVTRKAQDDDIYGVVNKGAKWLGESAHYTFEYNGGAFLDDAFTGATFLGQDGKSLIHDTHDLLGSSAKMSNKGAGVGFSLAGVTQLMELADHAVNQQGDPIVVQLNKVIIPNTQAAKQAAIKIFGMEKEPWTANNDDNAIKKQLGSITYQTSRYMASDSNYFMIAESLNDAWFRPRKALEITDYVDPKTKVLQVDAYTRFMTYFYDFRGWYGQNPT